MMIQIRPVSDLRNKFPEIEKAVSGGNPVFLTKNGYGAMVVMSLEKYTELTDDVIQEQQKSQKRQLGFLKDIVPPLPDSFFDPLPEEDLQAWGL